MDWTGVVVLAVFSTAYLFVLLEDYTHLRKSKPVLLAAGLIWITISIGSVDKEPMQHAIEHFLLEFSQLFLFLLAAMTYVNAMSDRGVFDALRGKLVQARLSLRSIFWITGGLSFFLSPVLDNLTTALVMCAVVMAVGRDHTQFVALSCVNIVVASNAGGAFSPFGDITTLMVWQAGHVELLSFFNLFIPALVNFLVPAVALSLAIPAAMPEVQNGEDGLKRGGLVIVGLFACTIITAVSLHQFLHLPPFLGMMTGFAYLQLYGFYLRRTFTPEPNEEENPHRAGDIQAFDSFEHVARAEWDTLLFFFGVIMSVGGIGFLGYLASLSDFMYMDLGPMQANILVGVLSAVIDNIPVMVAVLEMNPEMDLQQWLLVTLTAGVGGSLLSVGSAAGVALMGHARGVYTFTGHLKWTPVIALGYAASIATHMLING